MPPSRPASRDGEVRNAHDNRPNPFRTMSASNHRNTPVTRRATLQTRTVAITSARRDRASAMNALLAQNLGGERQDDDDRQQQDPADKKRRAMIAQGEGHLQGDVRRQ